MFIPCRKDMTDQDLVYVSLCEVNRLKACPGQFCSDREKLFKSQAWQDLAHRFKTDMHQTVANHPRGIGLKKQCNQSILQRLRTQGIFGTNEWNVNLRITEIQFNQPDIQQSSTVTFRE